MESIAPSPAVVYHPPMPTPADLAIVLVLLASCSAEAPEDMATLEPDAGSSGACIRELAPPDRARSLVVSMPYDANGSADSRYALLALSEDGELSATEHEFAMGRAVSGEIVFTPDGAIGMLAQEDGSIGVFEIGPDGVPRVLDEHFEGSFYADKIVMGPNGSSAFVLDNQWRENGGGVYELEIGCDKSITDRGRVIEAKLGAELLPIGDGRALYAAKDVLDSALAQDAHLLSWDLQGPPTATASVLAFTDGEASIGSAATTRDGKMLFLGDTSEFSGVPNRIAAIAVGTDGLSTSQVFTPIQDPYDLAVSPDGKVLLVVSGYGDALFVFDLDPSSATPLSLRGEVSYQGPGPQLPGRAVQLAQGKLDGWVFVAENTGVRSLSFESDSLVVDRGSLNFGAGVEFIVGAIGIQP